MKFQTEYTFEAEVRDLSDSEEVLDCEIRVTLNVHHDKGDYYQPPDTEIWVERIEEIRMVGSWGSHFKVSYEDCMNNYKFYFSERFSNKYKMLNLEQYLDAAVHDISLNDLDIDDGGYYD
jgi:hypothetical protein